MPFQANYKRPFASFVKKQHRPFQAVIEDEVFAVCNNPMLGEEKVGDLARIRVHKFRYQKKEYLMAYYCPDGNDIAVVVPAEVQLIFIDFYQVGSHENFYNDLKAYLRASGWYP